MKKIHLILIVFCAFLLMSCTSKETGELSYSKNDIYLESTECGYISKFPRELLIISTQKQLDNAVNIYKGFSSLPRISEITEEYPVGKYVYVMQYSEVTYGEKVVCDKLLIDKNSVTIRLEHSIKNKARENPTAINGYITYAILPEEYLQGYDFSNQKGVLYVAE